MKRILAALVCTVLGCTPEPTPVMPAPEVFRDTAAQIASQTDVTAARLAGDWHIRQSFAGDQHYGNNFTLTTLPNGALQVSYPQTICLHGHCSEVNGPLILLTPTGPGRWTPVDPPSRWPTGEIWVMWMDFDSRTAALGTPSGEFGWIMDKNRIGGGDRITAARDIMDWFGYDMDRLEEVSE